MLDPLDESLLTWDGEIDEDAEVPDEIREQFRENARRARELAVTFDHSPLCATAPVTFRVDSYDRDLVAPRDRCRGPQLLPSLRERISTWRASLASDQGD